MKLNPEKIQLAIVLRIQKDGTFGHIIGHVETPNFNEERGTTHLPYGHPLDGLVLHSQASEGNDEIYGYEVCASNSHHPTQYRLEQSLKVLRPINKSLERQRRQLGRVLSYGQWVSRVAFAIGAKLVVIQRLENKNGTMWLSNRPGEMVGTIDHIAKDLIAWCNRNKVAA